MRTTSFFLLAALMAAAPVIPAQTNPRVVETPHDGGSDPAAVARAQDKFAKAFALVRTYESNSKRLAVADASWRQAMLAALMAMDGGSFADIAEVKDPAQALFVAQTAAARVRTGQAKALGVPTADLVFVPITPCRILDTRAGNPIAAKQTTSFSYAATNTGAGSCTVSGQLQGNPQTPAAEAVNVTLDETNLTGFAAGSFLSIFPYGSAAPTSSFMNFGPGQVIANAGIILLNQTNGLFYVRANAPTNVIIDVYGLFLSPQATALECTDTEKVSGTVGANYTVLRLISGSCPASYTAVGGGCFGGNSTLRLLEEATLSVNNQWVCRFENETSVPFDAAAVTHCCRVPGR